MSTVTEILSQIESGDHCATDRLLPVVYDELRKLAAFQLAREKPGHTLQPTALVHEAYLRLVDPEKSETWNSVGHFFAAAAEAMRRILVDQARHKRSQRAEGEYKRIDMSSVEPETLGPQLDMLALDEALKQFAKHDSRACSLVKLRFFAGLTVPQAAEALGVSVATAENDWAYAKSWLKVQLTEST